MRKLETIQTKENLNDVYAFDEKGNGGAHHVYNIVSAGVPPLPLTTQIPVVNVIISFQDGPRKESNSKHGVLDTDLLEIVRDRLKCFQEGPFASEYNAEALQYIEKALEAMNRRVEDRIKRNVLGTNQK